MSVEQDQDISSDPHAESVTAKTILIIEDSLTTCDLLRQILEPEGYRIVVAHDSSGLAVGFSENPDLILLDLNLPDCHGADLSRTFKSNAKTLAVPIVLMTTSWLQDACDTGVQADGYLPKPFAISDVLATVHFYLDQKSIVRGG